MSSFRSIVEQAWQLQQQRFTIFRPPVTLFAAFVIFSGVPIVARVSVAPVSALSTTLWKAITKSDASDNISPLSSFFNLFTRALNTACLRVRIYVKVPIQWRELFHRDGRHRGDETYATPCAEAKYWRVASRYRRRLYSGNDATSSPSNISTASQNVTPIPLVAYYTPRLLPSYRGDHSNRKRTSRETGVEAQEGRVSPRTFCKWHRMVFQDMCHPTLAQAAVQLRYYSHRDLREIQRIAKLLPDEQVFGLKKEGIRRAKRTTKYSDMWRNWLQNKGADLVIVFE